VGVGEAIAIPVDMASEERTEILAEKLTKQGIYVSLHQQSME